MNDRIKQLAQQINNCLSPDNHYDNQKILEKFAELIIAECSEAIIKDSRLSDVKIAAKCCVRAIKEHFGVEE